MTRARIAKTGFLERFDHLCNLQSAGNSPCPEVDVIADVLGQFLADRDIGELKPATALHHAVDLGKEREPVYAVDDIAGMLFLRTTPGTLAGYRL